MILDKGYPQHISADWPSQNQGDRGGDNNGRVFVQSWRWDPPKLSRKIPSFPQNEN